MRELGSARVLELGFNKITILPLKMSKLTKQGLFMFQSGIQIPAGTAGICRYGRYEAGTAGISTSTKHRGQPYRIAGRYGTELTTLTIILNIFLLEVNFDKSIIELFFFRISSILAKFLEN